MQKEKVLDGLRKAKQEHINWMHLIKLMVYGFGIKREDAPLNPIESGFGKWFYGDAQKLKALPNTKLECMSHVESSHLKTHDIYFKIHAICFKNQSHRFVSNLLNRKVTEQERDLVQEYYKELSEASKELMSNTLRFEKRILAISSEEIERIW